MERGRSVQSTQPALTEDCLAVRLDLEGSEGLCAQPCLAADTCTLRLEQAPGGDLILTAGVCAVEQAFAEDLAADESWQDFPAATNPFDQDDVEFVPLDELGDI